MYKVEFVKKDGAIISFDNVAKICYGKSLDRLLPIEDQKVLTEFFYQNGYFHLTSNELNISYHDENTAYVMIKKLNA